MVVAPFALVVVMLAGERAAEVVGDFLASRTAKREHGRANERGRDDSHG